MLVGLAYLCDRSRRSCEYFARAAETFDSAHGWWLGRGTPCVIGHIGVQRVRINPGVPWQALSCSCPVESTFPLILALSLLTSQALACLGDSPDSVLRDHPHWKDRLRSSSHVGYRVVRIDDNEGTVLNQYVNSAGLVFGVTWQAQRVPNLKTLLGAYFPEFQRAVQARGHQVGPMMLRTENLVVESAGHMRAFRGRAYVPRLVPHHLSAEVMR
jgi:hypothetical protein